VNFIALVLSLMVAVAPSYTRQAPQGGHVMYPIRTTSQRYGVISLGPYTVQNNAYNTDTPQTISWYGGTNWGVTRSNINVPTNGEPGAYPSIYAGDHWGATTQGWKYFTAQQLTKLNVNWQTQQPAAGVWDVSLDLWFNSTIDPEGQPDTTEIMIWLNSRGDIEPFGEKVGQIGSAEVWKGKAPWNVVTFKYSGLTGITENLVSYLKVAHDAGQLPATAYLTSVEAGFEIWQGGAGLHTNTFSLQVEGE
jgi:hypothetical protein